MRVLIQRVKKAKVISDGKLSGEIKRGLCIFAGFGQEDKLEDLEYIAAKLLSVKFFSRTNKFELNLEAVKGEILLVSQFTLYGSITKGTKPDFTESLAYNEAAILFKQFKSILTAKGINVKSGIFGSYMEVELVNDGPVTFMLESKLR